MPSYAAHRHPDANVILIEHAIMIDIVIFEGMVEGIGDNIIHIALVVVFARWWGATLIGVQAALSGTAAV